MAHSYNNLWIHSIWATKDRQPLISNDKENEIHLLIKNQFIELGCPVRIINGMPDHVHCLFLLNTDKSVVEIIKHVKGSTSHKINQSNFINSKFSWQTGYASYSVSHSNIDKIFEYIKRQKDHHNKSSFIQEYDNFLRLNGLVG